MSKMMDRWFQKTKEGDKGLTRPPASVRVSQHKNEVRSIVRGFSKTNSGCHHAGYVWTVWVDLVCD
jgi:hypothetical protein